MKTLPLFDCNLKELKIVETLMGFSDNKTAKSLILSHGFAAIVKKCLPELEYKEKTYTYGKRTIKRKVAHSISYAGLKFERQKNGVILVTRKSDKQTIVLQEATA